MEARCVFEGNCLALLLRVAAPRCRPLLKQGANNFWNAAEAA
jgi:hypothetical protein